MQWLKRYWFMVGLVLVFVITMADTTRTVATAGQFLKAHQGPNLVICLIFFFSGAVLDASRIKSGLKDISGLLMALSIIFVAAPALAFLMGHLPLTPGMQIGLCLVAAMPTTLSSGVVMTGAAGGNMAHALFITLVANSAAVVTIPVTLTLLLRPLGGAMDITIDQAAIITKIALFVLLPLGLGVLTRLAASARISRFDAKFSLLNQLLILTIVWMALSSARQTLMEHSGMIGWVFLLVAGFHGLLLVAAGIVVRLSGLPAGRRESVIFMGGQKTLPLAVILQVSLFPQFGLALLVCVLHHIVHLIMDSYLVGWLRKS